MSSIINIFFILRFFKSKVNNKEKQMIVKNIYKTMLQAQTLMKFINFNFSVEPEPQRYVIHPSIKHCAQINIRAARRRFLKTSVLNHNKIVLWGQYRKLNDKIIPLKNQGKCVAVIKKHPSKLSPGQDEDIDIVLPAKMIRGMRKNRNNGLMTVYVRVQDKQYRCILSQINMHHEGWVRQVVLNQYVPNEPNKLTVPIEITHITENPYFHKGSQFEWKTQRLDIICYNQEYPLKFNVDSSFVCPERAYRIGDLANTFPPGIVLAPHVYPNNRIFEILPIEKLQLHLKQKLMKSYLASTKKQKVAGGGQAAGGAAGGTTAGGSGGAGGAGGATQAKK